MVFFFLMTLRPPSSTLFPYTTLFRSLIGLGVLLLLDRVGSVDVESYWRLWPLALVILGIGQRSEEHTSELQSLTNIVCRLLLEKKKQFNAPFIYRDFRRPEGFAIDEG